MPEKCCVWAAMRHRSLESGLAGDGSFSHERVGPNRHAVRTATEGYFQSLVGKSNTCPRIPLRKYRKTPDYRHGVFRLLFQNKASRENCSKYESRALIARNSIPAIHFAEGEE